MSEFRKGPTPEQLSPEVQAYLKHATEALKEAGIEEYLAADMRHSRDLADEMGKRDGEETLDEADAFHAADLPYAIHVNQYSPESAAYTLVKVDEKGRAFQGYEADLFHATNGIPDRYLNACGIVDSNFSSTVFELADRQYELGWEPIIDAEK